MGQTDSKNNIHQAQRQRTAPSCSEDLQCQNINATLSVPGEDPVLVCPNATCVAGLCKCGTECERDPYTGICCTQVEKDRTGNHFCIEGPAPSNGIESFSFAQVPGRPSVVRPTVRATVKPVASKTTRSVAQGGVLKKGPGGIMRPIPISVPRPVVGKKIS